MNANEIVQALNCLSHSSIHLDCNNNFYISWDHIELKDRDILISPLIHRQYTLDENLIIKNWDQLRGKLAKGQVLVKNAFSNREEYTWKGFMWQRV